MPDLLGENGKPRSTPGAVEHVHEPGLDLGDEGSRGADDAGNCYAAIMREMIDRRGLRIDGPESAPRVVLAHGAGASMDSPFLQRMALGLAEGGLCAVRFEFPYMERRQTGGRPGAPDPPRVLQSRWLSVIEQLGQPERLVIGGKSLGGRIASMIADEAGVAGLVCLGYPFHPPGRPEKLRTAHLVELRTPALIVQGMRDPFGTPAEIGTFDLSASIRTTFLEDGDHSFKPRVRSGRTLEQNLEEAIATVTEFVNGLQF